MRDQVLNQSVVFDFRRKTWVTPRGITYTITTKGSLVVYKFYLTEHNGIYSLFLNGPQIIYRITGIFLRSSKLFKARVSVKTKGGFLLKIYSFCIDKGTTDRDREI